jgi:hypothetical protein
MALERIDKILAKEFSERRDMPGEVHEDNSDFPYYQDQAMREEMPEPVIAHR